MINMILYTILYLFLEFLKYLAFGSIIIYILVKLEFIDINVSKKFFLGFNTLILIVFLFSFLLKTCSYQ